MHPDHAWAGVAGRLAGLRPGELAADLVRLPSHPGVPRQEEAVARRLAGWLAERGVPARLSEVAPGRPNLLVTVGRRAAGGRALLLCGHTDTVPPNAGDPGHGLSGEIRDGRLLGRGAADMKGPLAAMAAALVAVAPALAEHGGELTLAAVIDEEMESLGAEALVAELRRGALAADGAAVGEPTANRVALGHRGLEWLRVDFHGRAAHGGAPERGVNAILAATRFAALVEERLLPAFAARAHPLLGPPTLNLGRIAGGDQPSTVAARCTLELDRRSLPGETFDDILAELRPLLAEVEASLPGLRAEVARLPGGMATLEHRALLLDGGHPLARAAFAARSAELGGADPGPAVAFPAWTDGALLAGFGGVPTLVLGPGELADAHSPRESIAVAEIEAGARLYARLALEFCLRRAPSPAHGGAA